MPSRSKKPAKKKKDHNHRFELFQLISEQVQKDDQSNKQKRFSAEINFKVHKT